MHGADFDSGLHVVIFKDEEKYVALFSIVDHFTRSP
jgi:hypothetical protein